MQKTVRLILGDQLNHAHSWFSQVDHEVVYVLMEMRQETDYVRHHIQKVIAFFAAMDAFAQHLTDAGHRVIYWKLEDLENTGDLIHNLNILLKKEACTRFEYQLPDEYRLDDQLKQYAESLNIPVTTADTEHFITARYELGEIFAGKKMYLMETFYRIQRRKTGILMQGKDPVGGQWNFDHDNRHTFDSSVPLPSASRVSSNQEALWKRIVDAGIQTIGTVDAAHFIWPINRSQSLQVLDEFITFRLPWFGTFQDALTTADPFLFHSRLSFALNSKLLNPTEVLLAVESAWRANPESISINQAEGFIRQILGWREYMRGIYWVEMPAFAQLNFFDHQQSLPTWFWTGETKMRCLSHSIHQSLDHAYAHHIQRLMITGNFALLAGIHPDELDAWYLGIYIDAIEWVEITNTRGMSQFADGGIVGTKPYVSSAAYIDKMGDYCKDCHYDKKDKTGIKACPFNSLYWHFHVRHREKLERNPRIGMIYRTWDKMNPDHQIALLEKAEHVLANIDTL